MINLNNFNKKITNKIIVFIICFSNNFSFSQITIGHVTPHPHTQLDISATQKGILIPRISLSHLTTPYPFNTTTDPIPESLLVFNTSTTPSINPGYYYWHNNQWNKMATQEDIDTSIVTNTMVQDHAITTTKIIDHAVTPAKIQKGDFNTILTTNSSGMVSWTAPIANYLEIAEDHFILEGNDVGKGGTWILWTSNTGMSSHAITLPENGTYIFSFRLYGHGTTGASTNHMTNHYISAWKNKSMQDSVIIPLNWNNTGEYAYNGTMMIAGTKGDSITFKVATTDPSFHLKLKYTTKKTAKKTSLVYWKL